MLKSEDPIVVRQVFETSVENVWNAITQIDEMKQWYFENIPSFKPEVDFETRFEVKVENRTFTHLWKVTEAIPFKKIRYNWKFEEYTGDSFVTFELLEEGQQIQLTVTAEVTEDFPPDIPEFKRESGLSGWNYFIKNRLKEYLTNKYSQ